jgi:uncharacterized membrane protein
LKTSGEEYPKRATALVLAGVGVVAGWLAVRETRRRFGVIPFARPVEVEQSITIARSIVDLYTTWRELKTLPLALRHLESITPVSDDQSHWTMRDPKGRRWAWRTVIDSAKNNEHITWRSVEGDLESVGAVYFRRAPGGRGTELKVRLRYTAPGGWLLGGTPKETLREELRRFKALMETGEIPTTEGPPRGEE